MSIAGGKRVAAPLGGHCGAAWNSTKEREDKERRENSKMGKSTSTLLTGTVIGRDEIRTIVREELNALRPHKVTAEKATCTSDLEESISNIAREHWSNNRSKVWSNKLDKKHLSEFENYAAIMQQNGYANRRVNFSDKNREINVPLNILVGEKEFPSTFLLDTGAQRSFISQKLFNDRLCHLVKRRNSYVRMYGVGGNELHTTGEIEIDLQLGEEIVRQKFIIADLREEGILGFDFCRNHQAEWKWKDKEITLKANEQVSRRVEMSCKCARVMTKDNIEVPARSEIVVSGIIERAHKAPEIGMIEPQGTFVERFALGVAAVLGRKTENSIPVRIINTTESVINVQKNTHIAMFSPAEVVEEVNVRTAGGINKNWDVRKQFQDQLNHLEEEEKENFYELLLKYQGQFMVEKDNIGRTSLVQHHIHTGDNVPVKQRPRREPLGMQGVVQGGDKENGGKRHH